MIMFEWKIVHFEIFANTNLCCLLSPSSQVLLKDFIQLQINPFWLVL